MAGPLDNTYSAPVPADQQTTPIKAAAAASQKTSNSFTVEKAGLNVVANGVYSFAFAYIYEDPENPSNVLLSPRSANFRFTLEAPDYTVPVQNLVVTPGNLSYTAKWDPIDKSKDANKWFIDAQIYESTTGAFTGEEVLVWNGTGNTATILVSNTNNRWIRVDTRDQDYHKKSVVRGPFKATDPIVVDTTGPDNVGSVTTVASLDLDGIIGFNGHATISWAPVTGNGIRGYRIRWRQVATPVTAYSYVDSPGTATSYHLSGLGVGLTYEFAVATYDEYNNTSSQYVAGTNRTITGTPYIAGTVDVSGFFRSKANPTDLDSTAFKFGYGIETGKRGLSFNANNYWYIDSAQSASLKVGGTTSNYLEWNGTKLTIDGDIAARGGSFSGNILMSTTGASIYNGTINTAGNLTGNGFALNSTGLKVANGLNSVTLDAASGTITANAGTIAGWTMSGTTLSKNNVILDSAGKIQVGASAAASVYIQSAAGTTPTKNYVMWAGNNTPDANAKFRVAADGTLYATSAEISGNIAASSLTIGATFDGVSVATIKSNAATGATALQPGGDLTGKVNGVAVATVTGNAAKGATAIQPSTGVVVNATTRTIESITAGTSLVLKSGGTKPVTLDNSGLRMNNGIEDTFFLDSSNGSAVFRGTVYAAAGEFAGKVTASSGEFTGKINATSGYLGSATNGWTFDSTGNLSNGLAGSLAGTTIFPRANNTSIGSVGNSDNISYYSNRGIIVNTGSGSAFGYSAFGTGLITLSGSNPQLSSSIAVRINDAFAPNSDNSYSLGFTDARWQIVRSFGGVSTTSDARVKTNIKDSDLGLDFIKSLRPVSYKFISGGKVYKDGAQKEIVDGVIVEPEMVDRPGERTHWGFLAQDVKEAIDQSGVEDFGGWQLDDISDPDSRQSLVHHQFLGPMTKAIQELSNMVESLQQEVNTLKGI